MNLESSETSCRIVRLLLYYVCRCIADHTWLFILDLLQVLSILTMERPVSFSSEDIRDEKVGFALQDPVAKKWLIPYALPVTPGQGPSLH